MFCCHPTPITARGSPGPLCEATPSSWVLELMPSCLFRDITPEVSLSVSHCTKNFPSMARSPEHVDKAVASPRLT